MRALKAVIDNSTSLVVLENCSYGIIWAGCFYGPSEELEELTDGDLLAQYQARLAEQDGWSVGRLMNSDDGLGERFIENKKEEI